jgi:hypothetical protein
VTKKMLVAEFLRAQAGWRLATAKADPVRAARCAAALLDAAAFAAGLAEDDRDLALLSRGGCFRGNIFDPGPKGISIARWWQFGDAPQAKPRDLIAALAAAVTSTGPARAPAGPAAAGGPAPDTAGPAQSTAGPAQST